MEHWHHHRPKEGLMVNFRKLKAISQLDPYPIPHIDHRLERNGNTNDIIIVDL